MEVTIGNVNLTKICILLCTLVAAGIATPVPDMIQTSVHQPAPLPEGYVTYSDIGVAYKVHDELVNQTEAKSRCIREGARLAVIDSAKKMEHVKSQKQSLEYAYVDIVRVNGTTWVDNTTGKELQALPWFRGFPMGDYQCVIVQFSSSRLFNDFCTSNFKYVCEISVTVSRNN